MKRWVLTASLLAAAPMTTGSRAADLDEPLPPDRYGAYDDPRYSDMYAHPKPPAHIPPPAPPRYAGPPAPPPYSYRGYEDDYERGGYRGPRHSAWRPRGRPAAGRGGRAGPLVRGAPRARRSRSAC